VYLSPTKSNLYADEIQFLEHVVSSEGLEVMLSTADKIAEWPTPKDVRDIKSFNGLVNYIAEFISRLADYSSVLSDLTRKGAEFKRESKHQEAFDTIKLLAKNTPICRPIDYDNPNPIFMVVDASNWAVGGYYGQGKDYKTMRPAGFHSRSLNSAERSYPMHDKEMLAIIDCLKKWEPILTGTRFEILTDHAPLTHWKTQKDLSPRQIRWNEVLARFDTDIHHIPGVSNSAADALSRYPYVQENQESDTETNVDMYALTTIELDNAIYDAVRKSYEGDSLFGPVIRNPEQYPAYTVKNGLIYCKGRTRLQRLGGSRSHQSHQSNPLG